MQLYNMKIINEKIKELHGTDIKFCEAYNLSYPNFNRLKKKHEKWITEMNELYGKIGLEIQIAPLAQIGQKEESDTNAETSLNEPD